MSVEYITSFLDPFDNTISQPKILDGSVPRSSGLRFRSTGNITLDASGGATYVVLLPGASNTLAYKLPADASWTPAPAHASHLQNEASRANVKLWRYVSGGVRLSLLNSSDQNEGYWEAVRIPIVSTNVLIPNPGLNTTDCRVYPVNTYALSDMANHHTFQTGKLKDLHRFQFKLNSTSPYHPLKPVSPAMTVEQSYDSAYDMIVIKLIGRIDAVTPSMIQYNCVSNHEVVYTENTALSRLATASPVQRDMDLILDKTKYMLPAIQIN